MRRSTINRAYRDALACFRRYSWYLPASPHWDITDFGLGNFERNGLVLLNLASEPEYCEKLMYARTGQETPCHAHRRKKEDIICRIGTLEVALWPRRPEGLPGAVYFSVRVDGNAVNVLAGSPLTLAAGSRVTIEAGVWHSFRPTSPECIIGEVSTANDDLTDNLFLDPRVGRFAVIEEDEASEVTLVAPH
jgi:D-lyxose ketol-isomerase